MAKQYFLLVKDYTGINSKPVEVAIKNQLMREIHQKVWNKGKEELSVYLQKVIALQEKENKDEVRMNFIEDKPTEEDLNYLCFRLFRVRGYEVRNANPRYHVQMPANWMSLRYPDWTRLPIGKQNQLFHTEMRKIEDFFKKTNLRTFVGSFLNEYEGWKIELIDFTHPQYDEFEKGKEEGNA